MTFTNTGLLDAFDTTHIPFDINNALVEFIPPNTLKLTFGEEIFIIDSFENISYGDNRYKLAQNTKSFNDLKNELTSFFGQGGMVSIPNTYDLPDGKAVVSFSEDFLITPLVFMMPNEIGANAGYIRFDTVTKSGFSATIVEPPAYDGAHAGQTVPYYAFLPGKYNLGAITIEVGFIDTVKVQGQYAVAGNDIGWDRITLSQNHTSLGVITSIQTMNNEVNPVPTTVSEPWITPIVKIIDDKTFDIALDRSQTSQGIISSPERIGYVAFSTNQQSSFVDSAGSNVFVETKKSTTIVGWDDGGTNVAYSGSYSTTPMTIASLNSRKSNEGGWLRYDTSSTGTSSVNLKIDHDSEINVERNHTAEDAALLILSGAFNLKNN